MEDILDCVVVGAGPAGLTAAIYLGRFRRHFTVIHDGDPRAGWIPVSHNHPGFPDGIPGNDAVGAGPHFLVDVNWIDVNYAPLTVGGAFLFFGGWWVLSAKNWFKGPVRMGTEEELERVKTELATALDSVDRDPQRFRDLGRNARASYEQRFRPEANVERLLAIYAYAIANPVGLR